MVIAHLISSLQVFRCVIMGKILILIYSIGGGHRNAKHVSCTQHELRKLCFQLTLMTIVLQQTKGGHQIYEP